MNTNKQELEMQKDFDLGLILDTTMPLNLSIPIKNVSGRTITITKVSKDCSCISLKLDKTVLAPGETATLKYIANLTGKSSLFMSDVVVESDAAEKLDEIQIRGQITGQVRIRPSQATVLIGDRYVEGRFTVFCNDQTGPWHLESCDSDRPDLHIRLVKTSSGSSSSVYEGFASIPETAWKTFPDYADATVTFKFVNPGLKRDLVIRYPIEIAVRRDVEWDPPQVAFLRGGGRQSRSVLVQSMQELKPDRATCAVPDVQATLRRISATAWWVDLVFDPATMGGGPPNDTVVRVEAEGRTLVSVPLSFVGTR